MSNDREAIKEDALRSLAMEVRHMRRLQTAFFKNSSGYSLREAKAAEKSVDRIVGMVLDDQKELFTK